MDVPLPFSQLRSATAASPCGAMDRGCRPLEFLSVDAVKVVGCFFRLRVQLVVDEGSSLTLGSWVTNGPSSFLLVVRLFNDEKVGNLARPADTPVVVLEKFDSVRYFTDIVLHHEIYPASSEPACTGPSI